MSWRLGAARAAAVALALVAVPASIAGCFISTEERAVPARMGSATLRWSINDSFDPNLCVQSGADTMRIQVLDSAGGFLAEYVAPCTDFATTIDLYDGNYRASARLENAAGPRTTTIAVAPFSVFGGTNVVLDVDFPASSFF